MNAPDLTPTQTWGEHCLREDVLRETGYFAERADSSPALGEVVAGESARWRSFAEMYPSDG